MYNKGLVPLLIIQIYFDISTTAPAPITQYDIASMLNNDAYHFCERRKAGTVWPRPLFVICAIRTTFTVVFKIRLNILANFLWKKTIFTRGLRRAEHYEKKNWKMSFRMTSGSCQIYVYTLWNSSYLQWMAPPSTV